MELPESIVRGRFQHVWPQGRHGARSRPGGGGPAPRSITVDGTEFMSRALEDWAFERGVQLDFIVEENP